MKQADLVAGGIGTLIGVYAIWEAQKMPPDLIMKIGPGFFPTILAGLLVISSLGLMLNALRGRSRGSAEPFRWSDAGPRRGVTMVLAAVVFCVLLKPLGFILTSLIFLLCMMLVFGNRKPLALALGPALVTAGVWLVFEKLLHLNLPDGVLAAVLN